MYRFLSHTGAALLALTVAVAAAGDARGEDPPAPRDDALDRLLEKLDKPSPAAKPDSEPAKADDKAKDQTKAKSDAEAPKSGDANKPGAGPRKEGGDVAPKDQALDSLLEKLGETRDRPAAEDDKRRGPGMPGQDRDQEPKEPGAPKPGQPGGPGDLTGKSKDLDEHLEELTGRRRKKKQDQDGEGGGPLSQIIKEMREVEQRLGKTDTGEETRKKQTEIVRNIEQLIDQMRSESSQSRSQRSRTVMLPGQQPGQQQQPGQTPGANAGGAPNTKPAKPDGKHATVGDKDIWGHLPAELRQEMDNVAKEEMLPSRAELIKRYYLAVQKKSLSRGD